MSNPEADVRGLQTCKHSNRSHATNMRLAQTRPNWSILAPGLYTHASDHRFLYYLWSDNLFSWSAIYLRSIKMAAGSGLVIARNTASLSNWRFYLFVVCPGQDGVSPTRSDRLRSATSGALKHRNGNERFIFAVCIYTQLFVSRCKLSMQYWCTRHTERSLVASSIYAGV